MEWNSVIQFIQQKAATVGVEILGALALYIVGRALISLVVKAVQRMLTTQKIEPTVLRFAGNTISVVLKYHAGRSDSRLLRRANHHLRGADRGHGTGCRHGVGGLLANFARGAFLLVLRPFKVGDFISAGGVTGHGPGDRIVRDHVRYAG